MYMLCPKWLSIVLFSFSIWILFLKSVSCPQSYCQSAWILWKSCSPALTVCVCVPGAGMLGCLCVCTLCKKQTFHGVCHLLVLTGHVLWNFTSSQCLSFFVHQWHTLFGLPNYLEPSKISHWPWSFGGVNVGICGRSWYGFFLYQ